MATMRRLGLSFALLVAIGCAHGGAAKSPPKEPLRRVVLVSIDGLKPEYLREADARGLRIPSLRKLLALGSTARGMRGTWPTVTYPAHATLVTGVGPNRHGILANGPFDPMMTNQEGWYWYAESFRVPTLWDAARAKGLTTGNVYWPVTVGAKIDHSIPQIWRAKNDEDDKLVRALSTPGLVAEIEARFGKAPAEHRTDKERGDAAVHLLETKRDALTFVYFTDLDTKQHETGPFSAAAYATLEAIDAQVGRVMASTDVANTAFFVVSDHGFASISSVVRPNLFLRSAGLLDVVDGKVHAYRAAAWKAGGTCAIVLRDPNDATVRAMVEKLFDEVATNPASGIAKVHRAPLPGFAGATLVLEAAPGFVFGNAIEGPAVVPSGDKGAHGHPPEHDDMLASFVAAGAGIRAHVALDVVSMLDVAPTIAKLLALELPTAEGKPIDAILTPP